MASNKVTCSRQVYIKHPLRTHPTNTLIRGTCSRANNGYIPQQRRNRITHPLNYAQPRLHLIGRKWYNLVDERFIGTKKLEQPHGTSLLASENMLLCAIMLPMLDDIPTD
mmetsp:Transcript_11921/g.24538  ORF Transcript_11921/g.24538 Transcript_11921/m.24538 type:complete len:110 (+) Transcript_11921:1259-1588(+)